MELQIVGLLILTFIFIFYRGLRLGLVVDDINFYPQVQSNKKGISRLIKERNWKALEPLISDFFYGAGLFKNVKLDHAFTLLIHLANCLLIYSIVGGPVGALASLLYMINPINNQTTLWLNGRRYAITILAVLLSWKFKWAGIILFPFMAWVHVSGVAFPLLYSFTPEWWIIPVGVTLAVLFGWRRIKGVWDSRKSEFNSYPNGQTNECQMIRPQKLIIYVKSIGFYFLSCLVPYKPRMYHEFLFYFSRYNEGIEEGYSFNEDFFVGLGALTYLLYEVFVGHSFWAGWFLIFISQWCGISVVTMHTADRYCSLANVGLMVLLAQKLMMIPSPYNYLVIGLVSMFYIMKYDPLFYCYKDFFTFQWYHINLEPAGVKARSVLAAQMLNRAKPDPMSAYAVVREGLKFKPNDFELLLLMTKILYMFGKFEKALVVLAKAETVIPLGDEVDSVREFKNIRAQMENELKLSKGITPKAAKGGLNAHLAEVVKK